MTRRPLKPGDKALWEMVARTVAPLKARRAELKPKPSAKSIEPPLPAASAEPRPEPPAPAPATAKAAKARKLAEARALGDLDRGLRRRLARGVETIDGRIDLHGMTQEEAHGALIRFIANSQKAGRRTVLVITGKGRGDRTGVLRRAVPHWLTGRELARLVVSYGPAHQTHGGDGAIYVRLRSSRRLNRG